MGTPEFAVPCLKGLAKASKYDVIAVFTQPDKPKGRKFILTPPPVKICAEKYDIPVFQPATLKDENVISILKNLNPDFIIVVAYGKILPKKILDIPTYGCINVHASLLPQYRGAAPIGWAIVNGEKKTGITTMYMDEGLDTGDVLLQSEVDIEKDETEGELRERLSHVGASLLIKTLDCICEGEIERRKQDESQSSYAPILSKAHALIDWKKHANEIHNLVRGLNPWPCAMTTYAGKTLKIYKTEQLEIAAEPFLGKNCGYIKNISPLLVVCGGGTVIKLIEVQYEGKKRMAASDFINGRKLDFVEQLGDKIT
jgi:methionyl-tRNA formyltransferase